MRRAAKPRAGERGAVIVTFALFMLLLLGFMGLALDLGHLFVIRTELQTSMDACALAAAQELNGQTDARARAINAGIAAGNANNVDLQSATWNGKTKLTASDIQFYDKDHTPTTDDSTSRIVRCEHAQQGTQTPLLGIFGSWSSSANAGTMNVNAFADATTAPSQSTCPLPLALVKDSTRVGPTRPFGYDKGDWIPLLIGQSTTTGGQIGWANLDGNNSGASDLTTQLQGFCGTRVDSDISNANATNGAAGTKASLIEEWNGRFGIYKDATGYTTDLPDYTGYGYTDANWQKKNASGKRCCAFDTASDGASNKGFTVRRKTFDTCSGTATASTNTCETVMGINLSNNLKTFATGGASGQLRQYGTNRRIAVVPVVDGSLGKTPSKVKDFACMLMLQPIPSPNSTTQVFLEYIGKASAVGSPCTAGGLPGNDTSAGPLVPVLIR